MIIKLTRTDLVRMCKGIASEQHQSIPFTHIYYIAFTCINDMNGYQYVISDLWLNNCSDISLLHFIQHYSPSVKLIKL